jgi:hypothetical protein
MARYSKAAYIEIATAIRMLYDLFNESTPSRASVVGTLADVFERDNPLFRRAQFYRTCGIDIPMEEQHGESALHTNTRR